MTDRPAHTIRPPWPDELSRVWKFLGNTHQMHGRLHPRIAVTGLPERIIAAAALQIKEAGQGQLHVSLRSRFHELGLASEMLRTGEAIARAEGLRQLTVILPETAAWRGELDASGFTCERSDEWWCIQRDAHAEARLATAARLISRPRLSRELSMDVLKKEDLPAVQEIVMEHGLANLERLGAERMLVGVSGEYTADLSVVVRRRGEVAGVMLVKRLDDQVFIHVRAVAKAHLAYASAINAHFMARFGQTPYQDVTGFIFSARPTVEQETIAMAKRFGGSKIAGFCYYHKTL